VADALAKKIFTDSIVTFDSSTAAATLLNTKTNLSDERANVWMENFSQLLDGYHNILLASSMCVCVIN